MVPRSNIDPHVIDELLTKIREGFVMAIEREVKRCRQAGLPLYISRGETVEVLMPDGTIHPVDRRPP